MQPRLTFLFLMLVVLPLALTAWLATLLWRAEQEREALVWKVQLERRLVAENDALDATVQAVSAQLSGLLANAQLERLPDLIATQPLVRHTFATDSQGKLLFPNADKPETLSTQDREFLQRTESLWRMGRPLNDFTTREMPDAMPSVTRGWHVWFYGDGPQWLYWQLGAEGKILGIEVERAAFLAGVIAHLKAEPVEGCLRLVTSDGQTIHQQGSWEPPAHAAPVLSLPCSVPMQHWHWEYHHGAGDQPRAIAWPYVLGFTGAAALLAAISLLVFSMYQRNMRQAAQRVSFVNQVSHELKTPLTNIRLYTELARDSDDTQRTRYLDVVEEEAGRLGRLIHNVLTFARQERQTLEVAPMRGDLATLVNRVAESWRPALEKKGIKCEVTSDLNRDAVFDADATEQILGNLLSNVEKYAKGGSSVQISVNSKSEVRVCDDGPGVPERAVSRIFEPFYRARRDVTEGVSGTGLGLNIARALAEAQGGTLVHERSERGACFVLRFPPVTP